MNSSKVDGDKVLHLRSVLITGANRGLGLEFVKQLLNLPQPPNFIGCTCRQLSQAQELQEIAKANTSVRIFEFDVTHFDKVAALVELVEAAVGDQGLNLLINNAGINRCSTLEETSVECLKEHLDVHIVAPFALVKGLLPLLKLAADMGTEQGLCVNRAAIVNISSILGSIASVQTGTSYFPVYPYRTAKAGLTMLTRLMGLDLKQHGILALAIHPGWVQTDMGGPMAPLKVDESISKIVHVLGNVTVEQAGLHVTFDGDILPW